MKNFIIEILILVTLITLSGFVLYKVDMPIVVKTITQIENQLEIVNLGTSHGGGFDYSLTSMKALRINKEGNSLYYDLQNYRYLTGNDLLEKDAIVVIPVSYFAFGLDENRTDILPDDSFVNDFYFYLAPEQIIDYSKHKKRNLIIFNIQQNFSKLISTLFGKSNDYEKVATKKMLEKHAIDRAERHKRLGEYSDATKNINYLSTLIEEIIKNDHKPILLSTPFYQAYNDQFSKAWLDEFYYDQIHLIKDKYKIQYFDYSHHVNLSIRTDLFVNSDHLNNNGRRLFSELFFKDLGIEIKAANK